VIQVLRGLLDLLDLLEEAVVAEALPSLGPRAIPVLRGLLDQKGLVVLRGYRVLPEFKVSRVFLDQRAIPVLRDLLDPLALPVSGVPLGLLERTRLVRSFPTTSPR